MYTASNKLLTSFQPICFALKIIPNQLCFLSFIWVCKDHSIFSLLGRDVYHQILHIMFTFSPLELHSALHVTEYTAEVRKPTE